MHNAPIIDRSRSTAADVAEEKKMNKLDLFILKSNQYKKSILGCIRNKKLDPRGYLSFLSWSFTVWLIFGIFDPFGFDASTDRQSYMVAERALSPFHDWFNPEIRDQITIVLLKEEDQEDGEPWPPKYSRHGNIIASIVEQKPRAFFGDITFQTNREDEESLNNMVNTINDAMENNPEVPVFIGSFHKNDKTPEVIRNLLRMAYVSWDGSTENYPLIGSKDNVVNDKIISDINYPAFSIFMELCKQDKNLSVCGDDIKLGNIPKDAFSRDMEIRWLSTTPPQLADTVSESEEASNRECHNYEKKDDASINRMLSRLYAASRNLLIPAKEVIDKVIPQHYLENKTTLSCPPFITLSTEQLTSDRWRHFIEDKIVFFGHHLLASRDSHETPVHGYMPGVFIHAMALENLLRYGEDYSKTSKEYLDIIKETDVIELLIVVILSLIFKYISDLKQNSTTSATTKDNNEAVIVLSMMAAIVTGAVLISIFRLLPHSNLIAIATMAFLIKEHASWEWGARLKRKMINISIFIIFLSLLTYICTVFHLSHIVWAATSAIALILGMLLPHPPPTDPTPRKKQKNDRRAAKNLLVLWSPDIANRQRIRKKICFLTITGRPLKGRPFTNGRKSW